MIKAGHLPPLEGFATKAVQAIQRLPEKERETLQPVLAELRAALISQAAFNRRIADSLESVDLETSETSDSGLLHALLFGGG